MASQNRTHASDRGKAVVDIPGIPISVSATANSESGIITFTAPVVGGAATSWTAVSNPGSITGTGSSSPVTVSGLTAGTSYTFTIRGTNSTGNGEYSSATNSITATAGNDYELITRTTLSSSTDTVLFSSIPQTYKHLQVRATMNGTGAWWLVTRINGNTTASNYTSRGVYTNGTTVSTMSFGAGTSGYTYTSLIEGDGILTSVIDYVDYTSTSKNKNIRALWGSDRNGSGNVGFHVGSFYQAGAITEVGLYGAFTANSTFAIYGIKGTA
jgi:hypothetical protein